MEEKKDYLFKLGGFKISKKMCIIAVIIIAIIIVKSYYDDYTEKQEIKKRNEEALAAKQANMPAETEPLSAHDQRQASLIKRFGEPPEGFEWATNGTLVAKGEDSESTCEDVVYTFLRSLSILDFSTAQRYSTNSLVIKIYQKYYSDTANSLTNYYKNFLRKQFKQSLTTLEINSINDTAVFADGTEYVSINVSALDLTDKSFWEKDKESLFNELRVYLETEKDKTKVDQRIYEYVYSKYEDGTIGKKDYDIELVVSKENGEGWLVSGDGELESILRYEKGIDVAAYIRGQFDKWYQKTLMEEQKALRQK